MTFVDLVSLILDNLGRRKGRVALTAVGVVIGTAAVVVLVSLGIGLQRTATERLYGIGDLSRIDVWPGYGEVAEASMGGGGGMVIMDQGGAVPITEQVVTDMAAIPGVKSVVTRDYLQAGAVIRTGNLESWVSVMALGTADLSQIGLEAEQGSLDLAPGTAIVGYSVPGSFYNPSQRPGQEMPGPPDLLSQQVKLVLMKWTEDGEIQRQVPVRIVGVLAETRGESDWSVYMSMPEVTGFNEWVTGTRINRARDGYSSAMVIVEDPQQVLEIADVIKGMGLEAWAAQETVQGINSFFTILQVIFGGVGAIALLVAAIGIANTMAMAILERTREIGMMKAVGATNRDVLSVFLGEAAGIGLIGGVGGVLLGWSAGQVINVVAVAYLAQQAAETGGMAPTAAVVTPIWLPIFALVFATIIGILSGLYPALKAATLLPVAALKYE